MYGVKMCAPIGYMVCFPYNFDQKMCPLWQAKLNNLNTFTMWPLSYVIWMFWALQLPEGFFYLHFPGTWPIYATNGDHLGIIAVKFGQNLVNSFSELAVEVKILVMHNRWQIQVDHNSCSLLMLCNISSTGCIFCFVNCI